MNLETWIATATENLAPKAVQKVREDITMHVETAVNRYQLERHGELEALEMAVKDLGDAKIAARGFEKAYLTKNDLENFSYDQKQAKDQLWFGVILFGFSILSLKINLSEQISSWNMSIFMLLYALYCISNGYAALRFTLKSYIEPRMILNFLLAFSLIALSVITKMSLKTDKDTNQFMIIIIFQIIWRFSSIYQDYLKWRKMRFL
jgi:hypothetical protein